MALTVSERDWRDFDVPPTQRAWMAWWIEMARFCYPCAEYITYLYPAAVTEAADLGAPIGKAIIIPNGMKVAEFDAAYHKRQKAIATRCSEADGERTWRIACIARIVPIKGLSILIESVDLLVQRGVTNFTLDVLGPTNHDSGYYMMCREKARALRVEDYISFLGTVNVRELLGDYDLLVLPSYNEGQPIVVLEAMTAGLPVVGTNVGGMSQLIADPLTTPGGRIIGPCGVLVDPDYVVGIADGIEAVMNAPGTYAEYCDRARQRVVNFFQLDDVMGSYNRLYKEIAGLPITELEASARPDPVASVIDLRDAVLDSWAGRR